MRFFPCVVIFLVFAAAALAQETPVAASAQPGMTVPPGAPLRAVLERRVAIKRVGEPVQGRLVDPVYVFNRVVLPAGSAVEGHIAEIGSVFSPPASHSNPLWQPYTAAGSSRAV